VPGRAAAENAGKRRENGRIRIDFASAIHSAAPAAADFARRFVHMTPIAGGNRLFQFPLRPLSTLRAISARVHSRSSRARRVADRFANFVPSTQNAGGPRGRCSKVCRRHGSQNFGRFGYRRKRLRKHFRLVARSRLYRRQRSFGVQGHAQTGRLLRLCRATTLAPQEIRFLSRFPPANQRLRLVIVVCMRK